MRHKSISDIIDIKKLEHESRKYLCLGFVVAVVFHAVLFRYVTFKETGIPVTGYIPIELIIRPPRRLKPFYVIEKRLRKKLLYRKQLSFRKPSGMIDTKKFPDKITLPETKPLKIEPYTYYDAFTDTIDIDSGFTRTPEISVPLRNRLFDDPGMYKAVIIIDPTDKHAVQGYVHIPVVQIEKLKPTDILRKSIAGLAGAVNRHTNITAVIDNPLPEQRFSRFKPLEQVKHRGISVESLHSIRPPIVYLISKYEFTITNAEAECLYRYLHRGGTLIVENGRPGNESVRKALKIFIQKATAGYVPGEGPRPPLAIEKIPYSHPLYSCFFDFDNGAPEGAGQRYGGIPYKTQPYLEGVRIGNRLAIIYSDKGYGLMWAEKSRNREQLKMGANMVVLSLLQRSGLSQKTIRILVTARK